MLKKDDLDKITQICKESGIDYLALFGSYARGDYNKDSDVDLLVNFSKTLSLFETAAVLNKLEDAINKKVDLVSDKYLKTNRRPYVQKDLITIYDER